MLFTFTAFATIQALNTAPVMDLSQYGGAIHVMQTMIYVRCVYVETKYKWYIYFINDYCGIHII
jgi:hypothetical protein